VISFYIYTQKYQRKTQGHNIKK